MADRVGGHRRVAVRLAVVAHQRTDVERFRARARDHAACRPRLSLPCQIASGPQVPSTITRTLYFSGQLDEVPVRGHARRAVGFARAPADWPGRRACRRVPAAPAPASGRSAISRATTPSLQRSARLAPGAPTRSACQRSPPACASTMRVEQRRQVVDVGAGCCRPPAPARSRRARAVEARRSRAAAGTAAARFATWRGLRRQQLAGIEDAIRDRTRA